MPGNPLKRPHAEVMDGLKRQLGGIVNVIPKSRPVIYLDYPMHGNIGDLLIHAGTDRFFADHSYDVIGRFSIHEFCLCHRPGKPLVYFKDSVRRLDALVRTGATIVFHGGGNLGDIYPDYQMFRELVIARYPDAPTVILPQSIHFGKAENRLRVAKAFAAHSRLFIFARDRESLDFALADCRCDAMLMPDMAHALWGSLPRHDGSDTRLLNIRRRDPEAVAGLSDGAATFDWDEVISPLDLFLLRLLRKTQSIDAPTRHIVPNHVAWGWYRDYLLRRSIRLVAGYGRVDTDRLHGMILGALLDMPIVCQDNSYGKISRYYRDWFSSSDRIVCGVRSKVPSVEPAQQAPASAMGALSEYGI